MGLLVALAVLAAYMLVNVARTLAHHHWPRLLIVRPLNCDVCSAWWASLLTTEPIALYLLDDIWCLAAAPAVGGAVLVLLRLVDSRNNT